MSIVTGGLGKPDALLPSWGLGIGSSFLIVIPLSQATAAVEILKASGAAEENISVTVTDIPESTVLVEYQFDRNSDKVIQRSEVLDRFMTLGVAQPELNIVLVEISQVSELVTVLQAAYSIDIETTITVIEMPEDTDAQEAIDKVQQSD